MVRSLRQRSGIMITLVAVTVVMVIPLLWLVLESFKTNAEIDAYPLNIWPRAWTLSGFSTIFVQAGLGRAYLNSIGIAVVTVASVLDVVARRLRLRLAPLPRAEIRLLFRVVHDDAAFRDAPHPPLRCHVEAAPRLTVTLACGCPELSPHSGSFSAGSSSTASR